MLHFVTSYMKQNKSRKQTLESAQYGLEISFKTKTADTNNKMHCLLGSQEKLSSSVLKDNF